MKTKKEIEKDILSIVPNIKKNPNNFPIINKWNYKQYQKNKFELFHYIEKTINESMEENE